MAKFMLNQVWRDLRMIKRREATALGFANFTLYCDEIQIAEQNPKVFYAHIQDIKDMMYELVYTAWKVNEYDHAVTNQPIKRPFWQFYKPKPKDVPLPEYQGPQIGEVQRLMNIILDGLKNADVKSILAIKPEMAKVRAKVNPGPRKNFDELV